MRLPGSGFLLAGWLLGIQVAQACQVPVFRYALERWPADAYRVQVLTEGALESAALATCVAQSTRTPPLLNMAIEILDVTTLTEAQQWSIAGLEDIETFPAFMVSAPRGMERDRPLYSAAFTDAALHEWAASPARQEVVARILSGDSAVWVMLRSGDAARDAATRELLAQTLARAQAEIQLPEGVIKPEDLPRTATGDGIDLEDVLRSSIPLKIAFSVLEVDPGDPAEAAFVRMLTAGMPAAAYAGKTVVAPVFGRGRCTGPMLGAKLTADAVRSLCEYLCGACGCSVKAENPGFDLLLKADWDAHVSAAPVIVEKALPELSGVGDLMAQKPGVPAQPTPVGASLLGGGGMGGIWLVGVPVGIVLVFGTAFVLKRGSNNSPR